MAILGGRGDWDKMVGSAPIKRWRWELSFWPRSAGFLRGVWCENKSHEPSICTVSRHVLTFFIYKVEARRRY